jgi:F-type H+-transporting ATPase subunit c
MEWKMSFRKTLIVLVTLVLTLGATLAFAEEGAAHGDTMYAYSSMASAIAIGIAVLGGSLGQAKTATAALEAIGRNPAAQGKIFVPMIIGLALIESLVLYAFVIALVKIKG